METLSPSEPKKPPRWRKWLVYLLAAIGALAIALVGLAVVTAPHQEATPVHFSADDMIDQVMLNTYGKYSETQRAWMYVTANGLNFAMRVVQRAKMVDEEGREELYFIATGNSVPPGNGAITGAFKVMPDPSKTDGSLIWIGRAEQALGTASAVAPEDIRFEALSNKTYGWVIKDRSAWERSGTGEKVAEVWNVVLAPNASTIGIVAKFPASKFTTLSMDCPAAQARYADWKQEQAKHIEAAASAASAASTPDDEEGPGDYDAYYDEDAAPLRCSDATFTYRTDTVPEDGFVNFTVTGSGVVNGRQWPDRSWKLVFDHKSFTYNMPAELQSLSE